MKIAIITSGRLPVPATKGGAVETKLDYILDYNATHHLHDITVYSVKPDKDIDKNTKENHYIHYSLTTLWSKIKQKVYSKFNGDAYYDNQIEYFLHKCITDIKHKSFDCIILANRPGYIIKIQKYVNAPIVIQINNDYLNPKTRKAKEIKEASSLIITCSDYLNNQAAKVQSNKETPVVTVHNGIDIKRFADAKPIERSVLKMTNDDFIVFFSGRLTKEKGILELIQAIKQIKDIPHIKLIIAGASFYGKDSNTTPFVKRLQEEAESIKEQVVFTGFIDYRDMPSYLKVADVIVVPSMWEEPFGLTVLEAMAAGVPLIATRCGGIPEICDGAAILIDRENVSQHIADAIHSVYNHPNESKQMAQKAADRSWHFDKTAFSEKYLNTIYQSFHDEEK